MRITRPTPTSECVDRYLASPQYGVRWARWWLDLARYGESNGFEFDEFRPARVALSRLGGRLAQSRPSLRRVRPAATGRRRPPARTTQARSRRPASSSPGLMTPSARASSRSSMRAVVRERRDRRPGRDRRANLPRPDGQLRPLPRPQVRPDPADGILSHRLGTRRRPPRRA